MVVKAPKTSSDANLEIASLCKKCPKFTGGYRFDVQSGTLFKVQSAGFRNLKFFDHEVLKKKTRCKIGNIRNNLNLFFQANALIQLN